MTYHQININLMVSHLECVSSFTNDNNKFSLELQLQLYLALHMIITTAWLVLRVITEGEHKLLRPAYMKVYVPGRKTSRNELISVPGNFLAIVYVALGRDEPVSG